MNPSATSSPVSDTGLNPFLVTRRFGEPQWHADGDLLALAYAPDATLWTVEEPGVLRHWHGTGRLLSRHALSDMETLWVFGPRAEMVAAGSGDLVVWETATRKQLAWIPQDTWITAIAFHPTRRLIATGHDDGSIRLWDLGDESPQRELRHHTQAVSALRFNADGSLLASAGEDRAIAIWDMAAGALVRAMTGHTDRIPALAWQPGKRRLVSAGWDTTVRVWDVDTGEPLVLLNTHSDQVHTLAFSPDGQLLAVADSSANIHIWSEVERGKEIHVLPGDREEVRCLAFSADAKRLAVGGTDRVIHIWDPWQGELTAGTGFQTAHAIDVSPDFGTSLLVSTGSETIMQAWDLVAGSVRAPAGAALKPLAVACSPDGRWVAFTSANPESRLHIWDNQTRQLRPPVEGPRAPITGLAFAADSRTLASGCRSDGTAWLWNPADGEPKLIIPEAAEGCTVEAVAFHPDGVRLACGGIDYLATSGSNGVVTIWNTDERVRIVSLDGSCLSLEFDPSGRWLAVASTEATVYVWDVEAQELRYEIGGPTGRVNAVTFSPDGRLLAAGSDDRTLRIWDSASGRPLCVRELDTPIRGVRFSRDGQTLYTANGNTTCYELPVQRLLDGGSGEREVVL